MRIESQSLSGYLYNRLDLIEFPGTPEDLWKEILIFPGESWPKDFGKKGASILDPSRVLGRMFCVKIDKYMKKYLRKDPLRINVPISWLLRIAEEKEWTPEDVLLYCEKNCSGGAIKEEIFEIKRDFPKIFSYESGREKIDSRAKFRKLLSVCNKDFKEGRLLHISAPKFHKSWEGLVGDRVNDDDAIDAKQQWSMSVNGELEELCQDAAKGCTILQAGGGHLLLLVPRGKDNEMEKLSKRILKKIRDGFIEKREWSPKLWATWDDKIEEMEHEREISSDDIIKSLKSEYDLDEERRHSVKAAWRIFKFGTRTHDSPSANNENHAIAYLDVIGLGDHCWPKQKCSNCDNIPESEICENCGSERKKRTRKDTIEGFERSRKITAVIESTFGLVFARHLADEALSMGGDEIVARIDSNDWLELIDDVEQHSKKMHETIFDEDLRLLWWAMKTEGDQAPTSDFKLKPLKETVRMLTEKKKVTLRRFVNPMWTSIVDDQSEDAGYTSTTRSQDTSEPEGDHVEEIFEPEVAPFLDWEKTKYEFWRQRCFDWEFIIEGPDVDPEVHAFTGVRNGIWGRDEWPNRVENKLWFGTEGAGGNTNPSIYEFQPEGRFILHNLQGKMEGEWLQYKEFIAISLGDAALFSGYFFEDDPSGIGGSWTNRFSREGERKEEWEGWPIEECGACKQPLDSDWMEVWEAHHEGSSICGYNFHCKNCAQIGTRPEMYGSEDFVTCRRCDDWSDIVIIGRQLPWCEFCNHDLTLMGECITENCGSCKSLHIRKIAYAPAHVGSGAKIYDNAHAARKHWNRVHDEYGSKWWKWGNKEMKLRRAEIVKMWIQIGS